MTPTNLIPATQNEAWGFWGSMNENAEAAWPMAMTSISKPPPSPSNRSEPSSTAATDGILPTTS